MIEQHMTYDLLPRTDAKAWEAFVKKAIGAVLKAKGIVEFRGYRNLLATPQICTATVWNSVADWGTFSQSAEWQALEGELRTFVTNIRVELWRPSPVVPEPLRPGKN